jgi:hypothetical protein
VNTIGIFKLRPYRLILLVLLLTLMAAGCGGGAYVGPPSTYYDDMHYRNPWYGHRHPMRPPNYIGPPPIVMPPPMPPTAPPVAVPMPM